MALQEGAVWDAHAELDIGVLIHSYLIAHPAPSDSQAVGVLAESARDLQEAGRAHLAHLHRRPLTSIDGDGA